MNHLRILKIPMKKEIIDRLEALGADISLMTGHSMLEDLQAIRFKSFLYDEEYLDIVGCELINQYLIEHRNCLSDDIEEMTNIIVNHFWYQQEDTPADEIYLGQIYYKGKMFAPFDEASADYLEWVDDLDEFDFSVIQDVVGDVKHPSFFNIFDSHGFPDSYFICMQDPNPDNPTIFGTDHEEFFVEVTNYGTLEEFLNLMLLKDEFKLHIKEYLESKAI